MELKNKVVNELENGTTAGTLFVLLLFMLVILALSWGIACAVTYVVMCCFGAGASYTLLMGTVVWLLFLLVEGIFYRG